MKRVRIISIVVSAVMLVTVLFTLSGCADQYPKKVEGDVWTYYILKSGDITLGRLNPDAVPEDGVLYMPDHIGKRKVVGYGISLGGGFAEHFTVGADIPKIVAAAGLPVTYDFWLHARIYEMESTQPEKMYFTSTRRNIIVPDGYKEAYIAAMEAQEEGLSLRQNVIEKSEVVDWVVDEDGILKGYFGLESDHLVLPAGIKKIDGASFIGGGGVRPKTIVLNEDLEEIGSYGLNFGFVDEITIPKSVKYLDEFSVNAKKVYLYRSTVCHERAFLQDVIVYLD